jgi:hypothetical protein
VSRAARRGSSIVEDSAISALSRRVLDFIGSGDDIIL